MNDELINHVEKILNSKIKSYNKITDIVYKISLDNQQDYILKKMKKKVSDIFDFLVMQKVDNVLYPEKVFMYENSLYSLFSHIKEIKYPANKKVLDLKIALKNMHDKTKLDKTLDDKNFKYFYRIYQKLDQKFNLLELFIRESEANVKKTDFDWIVLSKYHTFLTCKKEMYQLQKSLHAFIDQKISVIYCLNHGSPNLNHLMNKKLISFEYAKISVVVGDIAKFYIENNHINIDWFQTINIWLEEYKHPFYKIYFKFLVLYLYILNIDINNLDQYKAVNNYTRIEFQVRKFLNSFDTYR